MLKELPVITQERQELYLITAQVQQAVTESGVQQGICVLFSPHTTAGLTINSYLDPTTGKDLQFEINRLVPTRLDFIHIVDTPSDAAGHIKSSLIGNQLTLIIQDGKVMLGSSQGIFFWEYDGPRKRKVWLKIIEG